MGCACPRAGTPSGWRCAVAARFGERLRRERKNHEDGNGAAGTLYLTRATMYGGKGIAAVAPGVFADLPRLQTIYIFGNALGCVPGAATTTKIAGAFRCPADCSIGTFVAPSAVPPTAASAADGSAVLCKQCPPGLTTAGVGAAGIESCVNPASLPPALTPPASGGAGATPAPTPPANPAPLKFDPRFSSKIRGNGPCATGPQDYAAKRSGPAKSPRLWCPNDQGRPCSRVCTASSAWRNHCAVDLVAAPNALVYAPFGGVVTAVSEDKTKCSRNWVDIEAGEQFHLRVRTRCACVRVFTYTEPSDPDSEFKGYWVRLIYARPAPEIKVQTKVREDCVRTLREYLRVSSLCLSHKSKACDQFVLFGL